MKDRDGVVLAQCVEDLDDVLNGGPEVPGILGELIDDELAEFVDDVVGTAIDRLRRRLHRGRQGHTTRDGRTYEEQPLPMETT